MLWFVAFSPIRTYPQYSLSWQAVFLPSGRVVDSYLLAAAMRLLNTRTRRFESFEHAQDVSYAILSHVWAKGQDGRPQEQSFHELQAIQASYPVGSDVPLDEGRLSPKIVNLCRIALADGFDYVWLDTACIDNSSSAELSEAINSMYHWYSQARICYAYLADVSFDNVASTLHSQFTKSSWFKRGWTLQELIAPHIVIFLSAEWEVIDSKQNLATLISSKTGIDAPILTHRQKLATISVAKRMSWAAKRKTTKVEDQAYCLMGIFDVHMPTVYGEGSRAFLRLQEEICKHIDDDSIFAWGQTLDDRHSLRTFLEPSSSSESEGAEQDASATSETSASQQQYLFAPAPNAFSHENSADLIRISHTELAQRLGKEGLSYPIRTVTPVGLQTRLPVVVARSTQGGPPLLCAILACKGKNDTLVALLLHPMHDPRDQAMEKRFVVGYEGKSTRIPAREYLPGRIHHHTVSDYFRTVKLSSSQINLASQCIRYDSVYIAARPSGPPGNAYRSREAREELSMLDQSVHFSIAPWCFPLLLGPGNPLHLTIYSQSSIVAHVSVRLCDCCPDDRQGYLAVTVEDPPRSNSLIPQAIQYAPSGQHEPGSPEHVHSWDFRVGFLSDEKIVEGTEGRAERKMRLCLSRGMTTGEARGQNPTDCGNHGVQRRPCLILSVEIEGLDLSNLTKGAESPRPTGDNVNGGFWAWTLDLGRSVVSLPWFASN
ncbi:HET-domain-containing protein [Trametes sanguinea]|nr:HET-domain-containing protein [Trametes sanguinea]